MRKYIPILTALTLLLSGCTAGLNSAVNTPMESGKVAGFWLGLWHGIIAPVTFVISLFNCNVNVYEVHNNGTWYNFGFVLGAVCIAGGASRGTCKKKH